MRRLPLLLVFVCWAAGAYAQRPIPPLTGRVVDTADLLSPGTEATLTQQLAAHEAATSNQVAVLTVPDLGGESVEDFARRTFESWRLGRADVDNGVLVLVARDDRALRIEVGYGLEADLTDIEAGRIIQDVMVPAFRNGDFDGGIAQGTRAVLGTIEGTYTPPESAFTVQPGDAPVPWWFLGLFTLGFGVGPGVFALWMLVKPPVARYVVFGITLFFMGIPTLVFVLVGMPLMLYFVFGYVALFFGLDTYMRLSPKWRAVRKKIAAASKSTKRTSVDAGWITFHAGGPTTSSSSGGSSYSSSSSFSSSSFSGGGGSSGGGGASGSW